MEVAVKNQTALTAYSTRSNLAKLGEEENKILEKKYKSLPIAQLRDVEILQAAEALILHIHVITGWVVPAKILTDILSEQFYEKLKEDYSTLNIDEIKYAFRKKVGVQDWGKEMNLELIDKVLGDYLSHRSEISLLEQAIKETPSVQILYSDEEIDNQRRAEIETSFQAMKKGYYPLLHSYFKEVLQNDGLLKEGETVADFFVSKRNNQVENIYKKVN